MAKNIKRLVSKNKRRFQEDGFDLDLTYICPNLLAMGFPAEKVEGFYRNNIDDVVKFLESKHGDNYKVYNLCSERVYDTKKFHDRVASYPFDDHCPPKFELIKPFCEDLDQWLGQHKDNIAAIHCKAGKGRTGVMICCYLLHRGRFAHSKDALNYYGLARTNNMKGVTIPSQQRYVGYYANLVKSKLAYKPTTLLLHSIQFQTLPLQNANIFFVLNQLKVTLYKSNPDSVVKTDNSLVFNLSQPLPVCGDIKIEVYSRSMMGGKERLFHFWFNTFFVQYTSSCDDESDTGKQNLEDNKLFLNGNASQYYNCSHLPHEKDMLTVTVPRAELDRVNKDEVKRLFSSKLKITLIFSQMQSYNSTLLATKKIGGSAISVDLSDDSKPTDTDTGGDTDTDDEDDWVGVVPTTPGVESEEAVPKLTYTAKDLEKSPSRPF